MAYQNPDAPHAITLPHWAVGAPTPEHPEGAPSVIRFKRFKKRTDDAAINALAFESKTNYDLREARKALRRGEDYIPEFTQELRKDLSLVRLEYMCLGWEGPEFLIPADADDPHAGSIPPPSADYFDLLLPASDIEEIEEEMLRVWAGRTPDQQAAFRGEPTRVARPDGEPDGPGEDA